LKVAIIGGGVIGALTALELTRYECDTVILEKASDVSAGGASKANSGIVHAGFDATPGTNKAVFNARGSAMMPQVCQQLDARYKRNGSMVLAFSKRESAGQQKLLNQGLANGVEGLSIITGDEAREIEPALSKEVISVLWAKTGGIVCPYSLAMNAAASAKKNGAQVMTNTEVIGIGKADGAFVIATTQGEVEADYVINAAGVHADKIANMAGDDSFSIIPRRGEYMLFDKKIGGLVSHTIFQMPSERGKGVLVTPTVDGNLLTGPNAQDLSGTNKEDVATTSQGQDYVWASARRAVPGLTRGELITSFAGMRAVSNTDDFILGFSTVPRFINAAGIQSPGLSASPAIAKHLASLVASAEQLPERARFDPLFTSIPHAMEMSEAELHALIAQNPAFGNIICRCETVTEGHILHAIQDGATDIDGVKYRTRAGMGRCQGGFCMPRVLEIIALATGQNYTSISKKGGGSYILTAERGATVG
jgi:glycerol-3-phosphate dehydrogenase